jgi:hypothetical protein
MTPRNDILDVLIEAQEFGIYERQEQSRTSYGRTIVKSFGHPLWRMSISTGRLPNDDALDYEARVNTLQNGMNPFYGYDLRRPYPRARPDGDFEDTATIAAIGLGGKSLSLAGLETGFKLSAGDMLAFDHAGTRWLHQFTETRTANGLGSTSLQEIYPHLPIGLAPGVAVMLKKPSAVFGIEPGSIQSRTDGPLHTVISFRAMQAL